MHGNVLCAVNLPRHRVRAQSQSVWRRFGTTDSVRMVSQTVQVTLSFIGVSLKAWALAGHTPRKRFAYISGFDEAFLNNMRMWQVLQTSWPAASRAIPGAVQTHFAEEDEDGPSPHCPYAVSNRNCDAFLLDGPRFRRVFVTFPSKLKVRALNFVLHEPPRAWYLACKYMP